LNNNTTTTTTTTTKTKTPMESKRWPAAQKKAMCTFSIYKRLICMHSFSQQKKRAKTNTETPTSCRFRPTWTARYWLFLVWMVSSLCIILAFVPFLRH
jgi:hypothetical protein